MAKLNLKIKKTLLKRKIEGVTVNGYYGRVITNGTKTYEEIAEQACVNTTVHKAEMKVASELLIDAITAQIKQGYIIDLGPLGKLYPSVNSAWKQDADELSLSDMKPKVNYKAGDDIAAAIKGASLVWTTEAETDQNTVSDTDTTQTGSDSQDGDDLGGIDG